MPNVEAGRRLRALLSEHGISQEELGRRLGYTSSPGRQVRKWTSGQSTPGTRNLSRIAAALDMPTAELISRLFDEVDREWREGL